jgi:hypothetical protein
MSANSIPATFARKFRLDSGAPRREQIAMLPSGVRGKSDCDNHLLEQSTIFSPIAVTLPRVNNSSVLDAFNVCVYERLRWVHSVSHATVSKNKIRFGTFMLSSLNLIALAARAVISLASAARIVVT